jgi:hypothetical protein
LVPRILLATRIEHTVGEIDALVYELYGNTDQEIASSKGPHWSPARTLGSGYGVFSGSDAMKKWRPRRE